MSRKKSYTSYDDLMKDLNNEPLIADDEDLELLEDDDLALLHTPSVSPTEKVKKPRRARKKKQAPKK